MPEIGQTISHYRILEKIGVGGMGEVYLADDLSLDRKVAVKFLPDVFTGDPERMARFEREAKLLASLNHPNIAAIYGLEQADGKRFLVLEYVKGETLQARLSKGALLVDDALGVCRQIAEGLEAAHEKGVIHRDLKPANVMITAEEKVKILDFGLAKALADKIQSIDSSHSPTITEAMTQPGVVLGTAAYISPEQAKGKSVDKRADIWAFGCIMYECLTGERVFAGETVAETLAAILKGEPDWRVLPLITPPNIRFVLRRCLEKEMSRRFHHAADLLIEIEEARYESKETVPTKLPWIAWSIAAVFIAAFAVLSFVYFREKPSASGDVVRFHIDLPDNVNPPTTGAFSLSPDGQHLVFAESSSDGVGRLWIHSFDSIETKPIVGTESETTGWSFWSPDSNFIVFDAGGKLKKVEISGGPPQTICNISGLLIGGSWNADGVIIFGDFQASNGIMQVPAAGGTALPVTKPNPERQETNHIFPTFLPGGRHFLYYCNSAIPENAGVYVGSLDAKPEEQDSKQLMATTWTAAYVPPGNLDTGQLIFPRERTLMTQEFDYKRLELIGEPTPIVENVGYYINYGFFAATEKGVLVYRSSSSQISQYTWFDRQGKAIGTEGEGGAYGGISLSPNGARAAASWDSSPQTLSPDIYLLDFARGTNTRFTFGQGWNFDPIWSPDGDRIVFASDRDGFVHNLYQKLASGVKNEELLLKSSEQKYPTSWSIDGRLVLYTSQNPKTRDDLWVLPIENGDKEIPFLRTEFNENNGRFSPDMRWVAYVSDETGSNEIYVRGFSETSAEASSEMGGKSLISRGGGTQPRWRGDGRELYYRAPDGKVLAVEINADEVFRAGIPKVLFQAPPDPPMLTILVEFSSWDVTADGSRFLLLTPIEESLPAPFSVILNWTALLKK